MTAGTDIGVSVILPAYGEAANLNLLLPRLKAELSTFGVSAEVLVVDSLQPLDDTEEVCRRHEVRHVRRAGGDTYGDAIRTGIANSQGVYVFIMDADGSHSPEFLRELWQLRTNGTIVIASRYVPGGATDNPRLTVAMSNLLNLFYSRVLNLPVVDVSNSLRLYDGPSLRNLELSCRHFDVQEEILVKLLWEGSQQVVEIPYHFQNRSHGRSKRTLLVFTFHFLRSLLVFYRLRGRLRRKQREQERDAAI